MNADVTADDSRRTSRHPRVGWFELFYDLVLVAAVIHGSDLFAEKPTFANGLWLAITLLILLILWLLTVLTFNALPADWSLRRFLALIQMLAMVVASLAISRDGGLSDVTGFLALAAAFGTVSVLYALAARRAVLETQISRAVAASSGASALVLVLGAFFASRESALLQSLCLGAAIVLALVPLFTVLLGHVCSTGVLDRDHLGERMGQLVIIVLGESFVRLVLALHEEQDIPDPVFLVLTFVVVYCIWSIYFQGVLPAGIPHSAGRLRGWLGSHFLLMFGAIGTASGLAALTLQPLAASDPGTAPYRTALPLIYVMGAFVLLTWLSPHRMTQVIKVHGVATALLVVIALAGGLSLIPASVWTTALACGVVVGDAFVVSLLRVKRGRSKASVGPESTGDSLG